MWGLYITCMRKLYYLDSAKARTDFPLSEWKALVCYSRFGMFYQVSGSLPVEAIYEHLKLLVRILAFGC